MSDVAWTTGRQTRAGFLGFQKHRSVFGVNENPLSAAPPAAIGSAIEQEIPCVLGQELTSGVISNVRVLQVPRRRRMPGHWAVVRAMETASWSKRRPITMGASSRLHLHPYQSTDPLWGHSRPWRQHSQIIENEMPQCSSDARKQFSLHVECLAPRAQRQGAFHLTTGKSGIVHIGPIKSIRRTRQRGSADTGVR